MKKSVTIKVDEAKLHEIISQYKMFEKENKNEYIVFFAKANDIQVTCYSSKKDKDYKVMFLGEDPLKHARKFDKDAVLNVPKKKEGTSKHWILFEDQIGSDEVGTGDFFGPITVAAAFVKESDIPFLKELGVDDSKRLTDEDIMNLGQILITRIPYKQVCLDNPKFNELIDKGMNMNEIKSKLHNQVLRLLKKEHPEVKHVIIDQFTPKDNYYSYLKDEKEVVQDITFKTKGESYFPCVAVGSIIARYSFLQKMNVIGNKYGVTIPFGASQKVTDFAKEFVKTYGKDNLLKVVKKNFANLSEVI